MYASLNWLRDFVDVPADIDPHELAERFTLTTAEVEGVHEIRVTAEGLVAGEIIEASPLPDAANLTAVKISVGKKRYDSVTAAPEIAVGDKVIYAPPGAKVGGNQIGVTKVRGHESAGMIVAGEMLGMAQLTQRAVKLPPNTPPGSPIDVKQFNDWIIEIDNKSITHRPDLWGQYGIAREIAAMVKQPLKPYSVVPIEELTRADLPELPIIIDDPDKCPRYSGLLMEGVRPQPAPLGMQIRLSAVGVRPIDLLVDLTNYIMMELGQPMHAFDGGNVDRIEVAAATEGETFTTLDGVERSMPPGALMIQCHRKSVALAGIMGGADTEVTDKTTRLLLESANFEPATIRRCATALGHRTEASARFEKSLDPTNTVRAIQRFVHLARPELPELKLVSRLSDAYPKPIQPARVRVDLAFMERFIGRPIKVDDVVRLLQTLEFGVAVNDGALDVDVPTFRATKDISIEADVIEEIARCVGYGNIPEQLPEVTVRHFEPDHARRIERKSLRLLCLGLGYHEIHSYIWYEPAWVRRLGYDIKKTLTLRNAASAGGEPAPNLRQTLVPGLLRAVELNRRHVDRFDLLEVGSVFWPNDEQGDESRRLALAKVTPGRKPAHEDATLTQLKSDLMTWSMETLERPLRFAEAAADHDPWQHPNKTSTVQVEDRTIGMITVVPLTCRRAMDEHLAAWSIAIAELDLTAIADMPIEAKPLPSIPTHPEPEIDFSFLADAGRRYNEITQVLAGFDHELLERLGFIGSYEGGSVPAGKRSFTVRARIGHADRTLTEADLQAFRDSIVSYLNNNGFELRG